MEITGPGSVPNSSPIKPTQHQLDSSRQIETRPVGHPDAVEISPAARMLDKLSQSSEVRSERLARIKAEIDAGLYETPEKLEAALLRLMDEIGLNDDQSD